MAGKAKAIEQVWKGIPIKPHVPTPAPAPRPAPGPTRNIGQEKALQQHRVNTATRSARQADLDSAFTGPTANAYFNRGAGRPATGDLSGRGNRAGAGSRNMNRDAWKAQNRANRIQKKHGYDVNNLKNADEEVKAFTNGHVGVTNIKHASPHQLRDAHVQKELGQVHAGKMKMSDMSGAATMGELEGSFNQMNDARSGLAGVLKGASKSKATAASKANAAANAGPVSNSNMSEGEKWLATKRANKERGRQNAVDHAKERVRQSQARLDTPVTDSNAISLGLQREKDEAIVKRGAAAERRSTRGATVNNPTASGQATTTPATAGAKVKGPKDSGRMNLEAGGAATENLTGQISGTAKMMGDNIAAHVGAKYSGNYGAFVGKSALQGAVWGGAIGGTISASQGGDFWAGAKEGAFKGAVGMAGWNGLRAATKTEGMFDVGNVAANSKNMWQHHQRVSKPVTAITRTAPTMNVANQMMNQ